MKTLADQLLDCLSSEGLSARTAADALSVEYRHALSAFHILNESSRAALVRVGRKLWLVPNNLRLAGSICICVVCRKGFELPLKSKRRTCARTCHSRWGWRDPISKAKRVAAIAADKRRPERAAITAETNRKRWARPGEREKLADLNRERWADPSMSAKLSRGIRAHHQTVEARAKSSEQRKALWRDPAYRAKAVASLKAAHAKPERREKYSRNMKARWEDPVMREKMLKRNRETAGIAGRAGSAKRWASHRAKPAVSLQPSFPPVESA